VPSDVQSIDRQTDRQTGGQDGHSYITKLMSLFPNFRTRLEVDCNTCGERVRAAAVLTGDGGGGAVAHAVMNLCVQ